MLIAITARGKNDNDLIDTRFGRAKYLVLFNAQTDVYEVIDNQVNLEAAQGAGIQTAQRIADQEVDVVITGNCGPKAFKVLSLAGIKIYSSKEVSIAKALELFKGGQLSELTDANVESHWV